MLFEESNAFLSAS